MDFIARKYKLIERFMQIATTEKLEKVEHFFKNEMDTEGDFWDSLPESAKLLLDESRKQSQNNEVLSHADVMQKVNEKYNLL